MINALTVKADGTSATTLSAFDSIDGGAGKDTLNIYSDVTNSYNTNLNGATVKNVETINIFNSNNAFTTDGTVVDASKFDGATAINQVGDKAANVTNLAAGTVAGFNGTTQATIGVSAAVAAATANVALNNIAEATALEVAAAAAGVLNAVTVSGTRVDSTPATPIDDLALKVTAGKDVESVSINTSINSTLTVGNEAGSAKALSTVDASASTGNIDLDTVPLLSSVATVKTGSGADKVGLATSLNTTVKAASVSTGEGDDTLNILATAAAASAATVAVDAGAGNDTINLTINSDITYNVAGGAGDDTVVITGTVKTTDKIDGGAGTDTVSLVNNAALVADDYIVFNKVLTNFETLKLTVATTDFDASQLAANYTTVDLAAGSIVTKVGAQALIAHGGLTATTAGTDLAATPKVYAGTLNITDKATGTVTANADKVALTVDASANNATVTLEGDAQSASVTLVQALNTAKTSYVGVAAFVLDNSTAQANLASVTLSGNGAAAVTNADGTKLVNVDASGLNSVAFDGKAAVGLTYTSANTAAETIKLGAGIDNITLDASTYGKVDVVTGLNLVASAADAKAVDATKSDILHINGVDLSTTGALGFTTTQTDLDLALKDAAAYAYTKTTDVAFHMGGNTYVLHDAGTLGGIDAADTVVKISGQVNLDLLASSLVA